MTNVGLSFKGTYISSKGTASNIRWHFVTVTTLRTQQMGPCAQGVDKIYPSSCCWWCFTSPTGRAWSSFFPGGNLSHCLCEENQGVSCTFLQAGGSSLSLGPGGGLCNGAFWRPPDHPCFWAGRPSTSIGKSISFGSRINQPDMDPDGILSLQILHTLEP